MKSSLNPPIHGIVAQCRLSKSGYGVDGETTSLARDRRESAERLGMDGSSRGGGRVLGGVVAERVTAGALYTRTVKSRLALLT